MMGKATATLTYGTYAFSAELEAVYLPETSKPYFALTEIGKLKNAAARWIIEHGIKAPETIRALRSAAGLTAKQLADLLGVDRARVSDWETGKRDPGVALWNTVAALALDKLRGSTETADRLRATQTEPPSERTIQVTV